MFEKCSNIQKYKIRQIKKLLINSKIPLHKGLTAGEIDKCEEIYNVSFPKNLRTMLMEFCPIQTSKKGGWYNWFDFSEENIQQIKKRIDWQFDGLLFDIEQNGFWLKEWGKAPDKMAECLKIAKCKLQGIPKLVPIFGHRYTTGDVDTKKNPVFSIWQADVIYYGATLYDYFKIEFEPDAEKRKNMKYSQPRGINLFWEAIICGEYLDLNE
ncbi:hypothetical protein [Lactococcus hircilactis]|uniref:hypothetical protein n=1 Tax=Lactococcus hircilactis TaxID=1494462 RepID=UPI003FA2847D